MHRHQDDTDATRDLSPWDIRSCATKSGTFGMTSTCNQLLPFQSLLQLLILVPSPSLLPVPSSSFSICEQSQLFCLTRSPAVLCAVSLGTILGACLLLNACNCFLSDFLPHFSFLTALVNLPFFSAFFFALLPGNLRPWRSTFGNFCSFYSCTLSLSTTKDTALCGLDSKSFATFICVFFSFQAVARSFHSF